MRKFYNSFRFTLLCSCLAGITATANAQIESHLEACFPFDGNAQDVTGHGHDGTVNGATLTVGRDGTADGAYHFRGNTQSDHITVADFSSMVDTNEMTLTFWAKTEALSQNTVLMLDPDANTDHLACSIHFIPGGTPSLMEWSYGNPAAGGGLYSTTMAFDTNWHFYAFILSETNGTKMAYVDTVQVMGGTVDDVIDNLARDLWIGGGLAGGVLATYYQGDIDDVRIYSKAADDAEVKAIYNMSCTIAPSSITAADAIRSIEVKYNPVLNDELIFSAEGLKAGAEVELRDVTGKLVYQGTTDSESWQKISTSNMNTGVYLLSIEQGSQRFNGKFVIAR